MTRVPPLRRFLAIALLGFASLVSAVAQTDRKFNTDAVLSTEAQRFTQLLQEYHYNREAVTSADYAQVVPDYMAELDPQHLFFLNTDKVSFSEKYGRNLFYNTRLLGNIDPAYEIYYVYDTRVKNRINWIFDELKKDYDFTTNDTYRADRSKSEWPSNAAAAEDLLGRFLREDDGDARAIGRHLAHRGVRGLRPARRGGPRG